MEYSVLFQKIEKQFQQKIPFVLYSLPESDMLHLYLQKTVDSFTTSDFSEKSFVFAPFNFKEKALCIPAAESNIYRIPFPKKEKEKDQVSLAETDRGKDEYLNLVRLAISEIRSKKARKIVTSRSHEVSLKSFSLFTLIDRLLHLYPDAMRYIWYHPETDLWCGATPEVLLEIHDNSFRTMALAGTRKLNEKRPPDWTEKEIEEQQFVTDAIVENLQRTTSVIKLSRTYTQKAGAMAHLRTDITGSLKKGKTNLSAILTSLHPTPAVCGTPQKNAKRFILENEGYDRSYYTGFLGPIETNTETGRLYVNLRCMKITSTTATIYVGGGITAASIPLDEWSETQFKLETMMKVLEPML